MTTPNTNEVVRATMNQVVMKKQILLASLIENKAKHDVILATAISGYWDLASSKLEQKKDTFSKQLSDFEEDVDKEFSRIANKIAGKEELPTHLSIRGFGVDATLNLVYPQDHSKDYDRAIRMMESSVFDEVCLTVDEFDSYVMNDWEWKKNFILSNTSYVNAIRNKGIMLSGCSFANTGLPLNNSLDYASVYQRANASATAGYLYSGINDF